MLTVDFVEYSTLHGINDLVRAERCPIKLLWGSIFTAGLVMAFYGCYAIVWEYLRSPVVVSYVIQGAESLALPDIIVCPFNRYNKSFIKATGMSPELAQGLELLFPMPWLLQFQVDYWRDDLGRKFNVSLVQEELDTLLAARNESFDHFMDAAGLDCSAMFVEIKPTGSKRGIPCSELRTVMTSAGKCWRIESPEPQLAPGIGWGAKMTVRLPQMDGYAPGINQWPTDGLLVKLTEPARQVYKDVDGKFPSTGGKGLDMDMSFVPAGTHAIMPLKATRYEFMNDPPRYECDDEVPPNYSRVTCFDECKAQPAEDLCGCSLPASANPRHRLCMPEETFHCFFPEHQNKSLEMLKSCRLQCPPTCKYWKFLPTLSFAPIPAPHMRVFCPNDSHWEALKSTIVLEVFFEDLEFTLIKHYPSMTGDSFLAQLGGQVSLWVGGSILTVVQLLIFLLELVCPKYVKRSRTTDALASAMNGVIPRSIAGSPASSVHRVPLLTNNNDVPKPPPPLGEHTARLPTRPRQREALV